MRKFLLALLVSAGLGLNAQAASLLGFEVSPELGLAGGIANTSKFNKNLDSYGIFGRVWLGAFNFVVAPQIMLDYNQRQDISFSSTQYGVLAGYNIGLFVARITPYVGINHSTFSRLGLKDTLSYNAGLKFKFNFVPISLGVLYTYRNPESTQLESKLSIHTIQGLVALHF